MKDSADMPTGIELGAEFIHGAPKKILELFQRQHLPVAVLQSEAIE